MPSLKLTPALRAEYQAMFETCATNPPRVATVEQLVGAIVANKVRYDAAGGPLGIPWHFVGVVHNMESSLSFAGHLHNGDPLTARTKQVPKGRPPRGSPPFTWEDSAADALTLEGLNRWSDWSVAGTLYRLELYNGVGYRLYHPHVKTPYLWSFSNHYVSGKYVGDGTWSDTAKSGQCGAAVLLRRMAEKGLIAFPDQPPPVAGDAPLVVDYAATAPTDPDIINRAKALQAWLSGYPGIFVKLDGWPGQKTSEAYRAVTGRYLPGDPRG